MEIASLILALVALIPVIYFVYDRHKKAVHRFEPNKDNTFYFQFDCPGSRVNGNMALAFYSCRLINSSSTTRSIKSVILEYEINEKRVGCDSHVLLTGLVYAPLDKRNVNTAVIESGEKKIFLMNWDNLRTVIQDRGNMGPGESISGSALFVLEVKRPEELSKLRNVRIVVTDFSGGVTYHSVSSEIDKEIKGKIISINFRVLEDGRFEIA